jgi:hypothetical protein
VSFGVSTITATVGWTDVGEPDELGEYQRVPITVSAPGCRHRPLTFEETVTYELDIATQPWKTTVPLLDYDEPTLTALYAMPPDAVIAVDGQDYRVVGGIRPHSDLEGRPFKATIISTKQVS